MAANHGEPGGQYSSTGRRYVTVLSAGQTVFNYGDVISEESFNKENERVRKLGETRATGEVWEGGKATRLPQTKSNGKPVVTVTCPFPFCKQVIEIPEYNAVTRSDALKQHIAKEHPLHAQTIGAGEPIPPEYRDLIGFLSEPLAEYSLAVQPAVEAERKIDSVLKELRSGVEGIQESFQFRLFLTTMSKFHDYSIGNLILIAMQRPDATRVAGFVAWKDLDRWVRKGEKGIAILAPMLPRKKKEEEEEEEVEVRPTYFKVVYVFDISQTEGKPLPEFEVPVLTGEANEELFAKVLAVAQARGLVVSFESRPSLSPEIKGQYLAPNQIWVRPEESRAQQLKSLLHEEAHYFSEGVFRIPRRDAETIAESAAYVVGAHYGFDSGVRSFPYVALWAQDKKVLQQNLAAVHRVAMAMLDHMEKVQGSTEKLIPALKPFEPYHFAEYVLRYNRFSEAEIPIYSGLTGRNPLRVPDRVWREVIDTLDGEFVKQGEIYVFHAPEKGRPEYMRAAPTWRDVASAVIPIEPPAPSPKEEMEFIADSPEFLAYTIEDIGYRDKLDKAFEAAIARAKGE